MVKVNLEYFPDEYLINYIKYLIDKLFSVLYTYENSRDTLSSHIESIIIELRGNKELISKIKYDPKFVTLISTLVFLSENNCEHKTVKKEVFKCIDIVEKLNKQYFNETEE